VSQYTETACRAFKANVALGQYLRVYPLSTGKVALAGATIRGVGTTDRPALAADEPVAVRLWSAQGTRKMMASEAITAGADVYAAASGKIATTGTVFVGTALEAASGDGSIIEVMHANAVLGGTVGAAQVLRARFTTAQVNAGATILPALAGLKYRLHDMAMIAIGGNAATATSVDILGTQSASVVKLMDGRVAGLTQHTLLRAGTATNGLILNAGASFVANDANTPITIGKTGSDLATATNIDVLLTYSVES
jgi:hypothetical protein